MMAGIAEVDNGTDIFGPQNQNDLASSMTAEWADVIGRRERRSTYATPPEPRRVAVRLFIQGKPVEFAYSSQDVTLPPWTGPVFQSLAERWGALPGWDSYQAKPTNPDLVLRLLNILSDVMQHDSRPPQITPLADGGIQAEWHHNGKDLEIVVSAEDPPSFYYFTPATNVEEESKLDANISHVQGLIELFL